MKKRNREINIFNISALDLFASATGVFMVVMLVLMPYYLKTDKSLKAELRETRTALKETKKKLKESEAELKAKSAALVTCEMGRRACEANLAKVSIRNLDLVFVMDTTGSMRRQIDGLRANLNGLVRVLGRLAPSFRVGFVAYRDFGEEYVTRVFPITDMSASGHARLRSFIAGLEAKAGGDHPEAVQEGLKKATAMRWRRDVRQIIVVIADAPAHDRDMATVYSMANLFSARSGRNNMVSVIYTAQRSSKYFSHGKPFFEQLASAGKGAYVEEHARILESILISVLERR